jgi:WD40 repeat protein
VLGGGRLASASDDRTIRVWQTNRDVRLRDLISMCADAVVAQFKGRAGKASFRTELNGSLIGQLKGHTGRIPALCVLPTGHLAFGSEDRTIRLWDVKTRTEIARLQGNTGKVAGLCAGGGWLASGSYEDATIQFWDGGAWCFSPGFDPTYLRQHAEESNTDAAARTRAVPERQSGGVGALCALTEELFASGSRNGDIRLWDVKTGDESARLRGHADRISALSVLPEGRLASGSWDRTIRLWDVKSCTEIARLETDAPILCLAALPPSGLVGGDQLGRVHWLEVVDAVPD